MAVNLITMNVRTKTLNVLNYLLIVLLTPIQAQVKKKKTSKGVGLTVTEEE